MQLIASGVESCTQHAQLTVDSHLLHAKPAINLKNVLYTTIELLSADEHVRIQASLRHAMSQDATMHDSVSVICTVKENPQSGEKRKASNLNTVTFVVLRL